MAYVPQNVNVFGSALSGAISGMGIPGKIVDSVTADYANIAIVAGAFAQQFDTLWGANAPNVYDVQSISEACAEYWQGTSPSPQTLTVYSNPLTYNTAAAAIIALIKAGDSYATGQGIAFPGLGLVINNFLATTPADSAPHTLGPTIAMAAAPSSMLIWGFYTARDTVTPANDVSGLYFGTYANIGGTATQSQATQFLPAAPPVNAQLIAGGGNLIAFRLTGNGNVSNWNVSYVQQPVL